MNKSMRRRSLAALTAAVGCLLLLATPAAATITSTTAVVTAGTLDVSIDSDPGYEIVLEVGGEDHTCTPDPTPESHIGYDYNHTTTHTEITTLTLGEPKEDGWDATYFDFGDDEWQLTTRLGNPDELGFGTNTGTVSGTHPNQTLAQHILLEGTIDTITDPGPPCVKGDTICHFAIELTIVGAFNWTTMTAGPLNGSGLPQVAFCNSPFAGLANGNVTITGLTLAP